MSYTTNSVCAVCKGRGEVEAGVSYGNGRQLVAIEMNKNAFIYRDGKPEIWFLDENPTLALWGIAICGLCRGTGMGIE